MDHNTYKRKQRLRRHVRVRKKISGTAERPRLGVFRSLKHIYGMLVDDDSGRVLLSVSTRTPDIQGAQSKTGNRQAAEAVGAILAERAKDKNITRVVFDRSGYRFHGRVKALADAARKGGLKF